METNEKLRDEILKLIENQLRDNNPPETKQTFNRLLKEGFDKPEALQMLGQCLSVELFRVIKKREPFNQERYSKNLKALPKEPFD